MHIKTKIKKYNKKHCASIWLLGTVAVLASCSADKELTPAMPEAHLISSITFKVSEVLPLGVGMDSTLVYTIEAPEQLQDRAIMWKSTNNEVATVSQEGKITAIAEGSAVISAVPEIGFGATASVTVNVIPEVIKATHLELINNKEGSTIYETDQLQLEVSWTPENHTYDYLTWETSDAAIATVSESGLVNCLKPGNVTITAITHDHSGVVGNYDLTIAPYIPAEQIEITPYEEPICLSLGAVELDVTYTPAEATLGSVNWTSSNEAVATVDRGVVTPTGFGSAVITATSQKTGESASVTVNVESGWWIWDDRNDFGTWMTPSGSGAKVERQDGKLVATLGTGNKLRTDLKLPCDAKNPLYFDLANYPVVGMRCTIPKGGNNTLDAKSVEGTGAGNPKCNGGIDLSDGTRLIYYDLAALNKYEKKLVGFSLFQIKVADIPKDKAPSGKYEVYWIRSFKSVAEMEAFAKEEINAGN